MPDWDRSAEIVGLEPLVLQDLDRTLVSLDIGASLRCRPRRAVSAKPAPSGIHV
jgi:hypothetical protein